MSRAVLLYPRNRPSGAFGPPTTPFETGLTGEFPPGVVLVLFDPSAATVVGVTNPGPIATFPAGIAPGTYVVLLFDIPFNVALGSIQIGNCAPPPPPAPTSKELCKDGGWRNYPQFKNQGQCVAFVNHNR